MAQIKTAQIQDNAVTNTKLGTMAAKTVKANNSAAANAPQDITVDQLLTMTNFFGRQIAAQRGWALP